MANSGYKGYSTLEKYYTDNGAATGTTKANTYGQADYIQSVFDVSSCPNANSSLMVEPYSVDVGFSSQVEYFSVYSNYTNPVTLESNANWVYTNVTQGTEIFSVTVIISDNYDAYRTATINIIVGGVSIGYFNVHQAAYI